MPDFFRDFLHQEIIAARRGGPPTVHLAAFGKHPAWNDHMEDIGLNTVTLLEAKRYIYLQGISGQIDTGAWNHIAPGTPAPYDHWLLWHRPGEILLGRLLASSDGKGRTRYPFIILAHITNLPLAPALETCATLIDEAARAARAAATPDAVRQVITQFRTQLASSAANAPDTSRPLPPGLQPTIDPPRWSRVYHVLESQLHQFDLNSRSEITTCRHIRLPSASPRPVSSLLWWNTFSLTQLSPQIPALLIAPASARWLDLIVGEPASAHFRCILSDEDAIPSITDTPYTPSPHITQVTNELLLGADANALPERSLFHLKPPTRDIALATVATRPGLAAATRPSGLLRKLFG